MISDILNKSQEVIDKATALIAETQKTQQIYKENLTLTETKIGVHNVAKDSHEDIRLRLEDMPEMISEPVVDGPSACEDGESITLSITAQPLFPTVKLVEFVLTDKDGKVSKTESVTENKGTITHVFHGNRNETVSYSVQAKGEHNFTSKIITKELLITKHIPPSFDKLSHTLPTVVSHGKNYDAKIEGIYDEDNDLRNITISSTNDKITFPSGNKITQGQPFRITAGTDLKGPAEAFFVITADDNKNLSATHRIPVTINGDPDISAMVHNIPLMLNKNSNVTCRVSGVRDDSEGTITYDIASNIGNITFSKSTGLLMNEEFVIYVDNTVAYGTKYDITLTFKDEQGGITTTKVSAKINTPPDASKVVAHQEAKHIPGKTTKISFTGGKDIDGEYSYSINNKDPHLVFSKTQNIKESEQVDITVAKEVDRDVTHQITVEVVDTTGAKNSKVIPININSLPIKDVSATIPDLLIPGKTYTLQFPATQDKDGDTITYTVTTNTESIKIGNGTNIGGKVNFTITIPEETVLARNTPVVFPITISDGKETFVYNKNAKINNKPDSSNITITVEDKMFGGVENKKVVTIKGGTDADGPITYTLEHDGNLSFSKETGIAVNTNVDIIAKKVKQNTPVQFTLYVVDSVGERSKPVKSKTITIEPIMVTKPPSIIYPADGNMAVPTEGFTMTWSGYEAMAWTGEGTYPENFKH